MAHEGGGGAPATESGVKAPHARTNFIERIFIPKLLNSFGSVELIQSNITTWVSFLRLFRDSKLKRKMSNWRLHTRPYTDVTVCPTKRAGYNSKYAQFEE